MHWSGNNKYFIKMQIYFDASVKFDIGTLMRVLIEFDIKFHFLCLVSINIKLYVHFDLMFLPT